jgi:GNAT superfamily N-acetyltransferase
MLIRAVESGDVEAVVEMGARMHAESAYSFLPYDRAKVRRMAESYVTDAEAQCGLVAEEAGRVVAMFGGYLTDYFFCDERVACDVVLFVEPQRRGSSAAARLVRAFREWARSRGAREICLGVSTDVDAERTGVFYERMGLGRVGGLYKQRL